MATISIFSIRLGRLLLTCERDFSVGYVLISESFRSAMSIDVAAALGAAANRIMWRAKRAVNGRMRPGQIFGIQLPDAKLTIGVTDTGFDIYCEVGEEQVLLGEQELQALLFALGRLNADVTSLQQLSGAHPHQLDVVGASFIAAVLASGDILFVPHDGNLGHVWEFSLMPPGHGEAA